MEVDIKQQVSVLFAILRTIYPKYHPFWFIFYMYVLYCRTVKRKIKYKVKCVSNELIQHCLGIEKCFNDVNNTVVVNSDNVYPCDKLLRLIGEENCNHRYVYVITERDCEKDQMLVSENLHHNLCNKKFSSPLRLLNFHLSSVRFADEISISLVSLPYDINNSICDSVLERYFKTPKLVNKGDIISIDIKYFATDLFFLNTKLNNVENIFFVCQKIVIQNVEVEEGCCCVIGETAIKQDVNIQSSIPKKLTNFIRKEDGTLIKEVPSCPYGLQENLENMQKAIRPFMGRRKFNLQPAFLLVGGAGSGKRILVSCLAYHLGMHYYKINNYELTANVYAQSETKLHNAFFTAKMAAPCIVAIHNFENFGKNNEGQYDERIIGNFSDELKFLLETNPFPVFLFCCSNQKDIPTNLKKLFLETFDIGVPTESQRQLHLRWILEEGDFNTNADLSEIANKTHGFLYEDLRALVYYARKELRKTSGSSDTNLGEKHFMEAIDYMQNNYNESVGAPKVPKVQWSDVGGLNDVKEEIIKTIYLPLKHPQFLKNSGLKRSGILLFGPPGTGKTLIAKAVATECSLCFLSVKGPELLNMYVGQSEQNIREVFDRARQASPCIIFFDELDSLAPNRGISGDSGGVMDRVVSQLLAEMDGLNDSATVFIIGATNRPDLIDPALLRPGRFDKLLYIGPCTDETSKISVLKALTRKFKLSDDVDLAKAVRICPKNITGADFYGICSSAWSSAVRRLIARIEKGEVVAETDEDVEVCFEDFEVAMKNVKPSISAEDLKYFDKLKKELGSNSEI